MPPAFVAPSVALASSPVTDRNILVTGGSGAFGRAFVRQCLADGARRVAIFSRSEAKHAEFSAEIRDDRLRCFIGDVRDRHRLSRAMRDVEIVVHAAALKRIEVCERDPVEAIKTNIEGTINVAEAAIDAGVSQAILLSTDKAASPHTLYGATKMAAERIWNGMNVYAAGRDTRFACTRYGNVLGSTGSVLPTWRRESEAGRPITVTDPGMTRFFMTMGDAVSLVMLALGRMRGAEIFVPKIGGTTVARLAAIAAPRSEWNVTGARPGEKRHELLISPEESAHTYDAGGHYIIEPTERSWTTVAPLPFPRVSSGFSYGSDNASPLDVDVLSAMVAA